MREAHIKQGFEEYSRVTGPEPGTLSRREGGKAAEAVARGGLAHVADTLHQIVAYRWNITRVSSIFRYRLLKTNKSINSQNQLTLLTEGMNSTSFHPHPYLTYLHTLHLVPGVHLRHGAVDRVAPSLFLKVRVWVLLLSLIHI